jgi:phospholipase C
VCSRWFCSVPGETWPNRNFAHAATSDGQTEIEVRPYTNQTIFELLEDHGADWRIYYDDTPQAWAFPALWDTPERHAKWFPLGSFAAHVAAGDLTAYTFIEPNHRPPLHTLDHAPLIGAPDESNSQHPENNLVSNDAYDAFTLRGESDFTRAERLVAAIYEALRSRPEVFGKTLLLITYDEHGGLYDHVPPPTGVPGPGGPVSGVGRVQRALLYHKAAAFDFTMLGPRVPAVIVSPWVRAGTVDARTHDHASIPATLRALFAPGARPLTERDQWSAPFHELATLPEARTDLPDLSSRATAITTAISAPPAPAAPAAAAAAPAAAPPTAPAAAPAVPAYYQPFLTLADQVQQHLAAVGEPEVAGVPAGPAADRGTQITRAFAAAADRHRRSAG